MQIYKKNDSPGNLVEPTKGKKKNKDKDKKGKDKHPGTMSEEATPDVGYVKFLYLVNPVNPAIRVCLESFRRIQKSLSI